MQSKHQTQDTNNKKPSQHGFYSGNHWGNYGFCIEDTKNIEKMENIEKKSQH